MNSRKHAAWPLFISFCVRVPGCGRATQNAKELLKELKHGTPKEKALS